MIAPRKLAAACAAAALVVQPQLASAQQAPCITDAEISAATIYVVPTLVQAVQARCSGQLAQRGFLAREGAAVAARYTALQGQMWPVAKAGLVKLASAKASQELDFLTALPDESVRPLVDALIVQEISPRIKATDCPRIERVMEAAAPLEPRVAGNLLGALAGLLEQKSVPLCAAMPR